VGNRERKTKSFKLYKRPLFKRCYSSGKKLFNIKTFCEGRKGKYMIRMVFAVMLIIALLGIGICDLINGDYKTFILGCLFAVANVIIFLWK